MNNPLEHLITWLWDADGRQRAEQEKRINLTNYAVLRNCEIRANALSEIRRTQKFIKGSGVH